MADNIDVTPGTGATVAADLIATALHQRVKITLGADGTNDGDVCTALPMPVTGTITAVTAITDALPAGTNAIGKLAANSGVDIGDVDVASCALPTGAATAAKQLPDGHSVALSATDNAVLDALVVDTGEIQVAVEAINTKLTTGTVIGDVNLGATDNAVLDTIAAKDFATQTTLAAVNAKLVTGTVIGDVNLGATDNAVLDTIAAKDFATQTTLAAINAKLVTGTVIGDVNLGATDNAVLDSAVTALEIIDNCISGSEAQVDVVAALPTGTNIIGAVKRDVINYTPIRKYYTNAGAVTDGIVWSPAAGKKWVITDLVINLSAAGAVTLEEDLAGGDSPFMKFEFAANGGCSTNLQTPLFSTEDDADLIITTSAGNVYVSISGYEID